MHFLIVRRRHLGVALSSKEMNKVEPIQGDIQISEMHNAATGRTTISAWLFKSSPHLPDVLPPLLDVTMTGMGSTGMNLTGVEQIGDAFYWQSWWCRMV
ncbi:hypothetical protein B1F77_26805 [Pseudomonas syringae]|nr:hypothetical protein D5S10_12525 [Pseudomonas savastanoi]RXT72232.1 hypothetical protein B1F77_26805 [Pseudomonas syringae]RXT85354.1 hypothetical protein B1F72_13905 [Pseudomonas syringae]